MARRPAHLMNAPREAIWAYLRTQGEKSITVAQIVSATGLDRKSVSDYLDGLTSAGYLKRLPDIGNRVRGWQLIHDIGVEAPRVRRDGSAVTQGLVNEQLWRSMCILKEFSFEDLIQTATVAIPAETARAYCKVLLATGYLRVSRKAQPTKGRIARYRLVRNNGPRPPQVQRVKQVYDPNTQEVYMIGAGQ